MPAALQAAAMAGQPEDDAWSHGSFVALEGAADEISTQLRLLPPSSKILLLPSLRDSVQAGETFNARAFIRDVHTAFSDRSAVARSFLKASTAEQPRLAFVNGGTVTARTMCITAICEHVTHGEIREAEAIFQDLVKDGVAGLMKEEKEETAEKADDLHEPAGDMDPEVQEAERPQEQEHPDIVVMKAADSADRMTNPLPSSYDEHIGNRLLLKSPPSRHDQALADLDNDNGQGRKKVPTALGLSPIVNPAMPEVVDTNENGEVIRKSVLTIPAPRTSLRERRSNKFNNLAPLTPFTGRTDISDTRSYLEMIEDMDKEGRLVSPSTHNRNSFPSTPAVVYGEAYLVDVQSAAVPSPPVKRVRSLDRLPQSPVELTLPTGGPGVLRHSSSARNLTAAEQHANGDAKESKPIQVPIVQKFESLPRTLFVKASQTVIKKSPTLSLASIAAKVYVDRGTDAFVEEPKEEEFTEFAPVFPVVEDLVIYFTGQFQDVIESEIFDAVVRTYKDGSYPVLPPPELTVASAPSQTSLVDDISDGQTTPVSNTAGEIQDVTHYSQETDPYNPDSYALNGSRWPPNNVSKNFGRITTKDGPLTPATTPPPVRSKVAQKFHEISSTSAMTTMGVQNAIRAVLDIHYSPKTTNYRQYDFHAENDRFWKPIFQYDNNLGDISHTVDQIVAVGCEDGVNQQLFNEVAGQVERMGTKKSGQSRSGRLDIRYLLALAFHSYAASCLPSNAPSLLTTPSLLSTLLIPQLEVYLSNTPSIRLLVLTFPASLLSTILHLRKALGSNIFKIAGIMDSLASEPSPTIMSPLSPLSNDPSASNGKPRLDRSASPSPPDASFSHADFLLPSQASPAETNAFLQTVLSTLVQKSDFYLPEAPSIPAEPAPPKTPTEGQRPWTAASVSSISSITKNNLSKAARLIAQNTTIVTRPAASLRAASRSRSGTVGSEKARERERQNDNDWDSYFVGGESDEDEMERILMPRVLKRAERKANSRKALKFLGLA